MNMKTPAKFSLGQVISKGIPNSMYAEIFRNVNPAYKKYKGNEV